MSSGFTGSAAECLISPELPRRGSASLEADPAGQLLQLIPHCLILGIGCRKGVSTEQLAGFAESLFTAAGLDLRAVRCIASIDLKKEEPGIIVKA